MKIISSIFLFLFLYQNLWSFPVQIQREKIQFDIFVIRCFNHDCNSILPYIKNKEISLHPENGPHGPYFEGHLYLKKIVNEKIHVQGMLTVKKNTYRKKQDYELLGQLYLKVEDSSTMQRLNINVDSLNELNRLSLYGDHIPGIDGSTYLPLMIINRAKTLGTSKR